MRGHGRKTGGARLGGKGQRGTGKQKSKHPETEQHAREVREVARGRDIVERKGEAAESRPAVFRGSDMLFVRSWLQRRPLEAPSTAAALVHYPRMWTTRRGRYCRFVAPGAGSYGLLRARPSF